MNLYRARDFPHHDHMGIVALSRVDEDRTLLELQREIADSPDLEALIGALARGLAPMMPVSDRISITLLEPDGEWMRIHRILPAAERTSTTMPRVRVEGTPVGRVVREGVGQVVSEVRADPNITFGHASHDGIRSTVSVPIRVGGRVVGALNAGSKISGSCEASMLQRMETIAAAIGPVFVAAEQAFARPGHELAGAAPSAADRLIGGGAAFTSLIGAARRVARSDADVLITGETGVGKTALARALHDWSARREGPFVTVHLADLTPTLIESELFGYERGAFTGASTARAGRFESAEGGTIFLDEISETPFAIQTKLLRVIQDRCFERVGGGRTIRANVRVIAASNVDLRAAIARREFREDLFFRLSVVPLKVPPLRERREDLCALVASILDRIVATDGRPRSLSPAAWDRVHAYAWPGNVRELESVLRRAAILEDADALELTELAEARPGTEVPASDAGPCAPAQRLMTLDEHQRAYIEHVLAVHDGAVEGPTGAARVLGVPPSTLRSRMKKLGIAARRGKGGAR